MHNLGEDIRWVFGSFLFSLVVSDIAVKFGKLFRKWRFYTDRSVLLCHLLVALITVMTSWIGWSLAIRGIGYPAPTKVFSVPTITLTIDIGLLICYYSLVQPLEPGDKCVPVKDLSYWLVIIFVGYLMWDATTALEMNLAFGMREITTLGMLGVSALLYSLLKKIPVENKVKTIAGDFSLILLVLFFRLLKDPYL